MKSGEAIRASDPQSVAEGAADDHGVTSLDARIGSQEGARSVLAHNTRGYHGSAGEGMTLDTAWLHYRAALVRKGSSERTVMNYTHSLARISADVRETPLRVLGQDQSIMLREWERIAARHDIGAKYEKGHGRTAADASAGLVRILYRYVQRWHDHSLPGRHPCLNLDLQSRRPLRELSVMAPDDL